MRLGSVQAKGLKGLSLFRSGVGLDFEDIPNGVIAVTGDNGQGKTTFLELPIIALYGAFPSRPENALIDSVDGRDAFLDVEFTIEGRGTYRARVNVDGVSRKTDAVLTVTRPDGRLERLNDGKISTFKTAIAKELPPLTVIQASVFASQTKEGSFANLEKKERKDLFSDLLGLAAYEERAQAARGAVTLVERRLREVETLLTVTEALAGPTTEESLSAEGNRLQAELVAAQLERDQRQVDLDAFDGIIEGLREQAADYASTKAIANDLVRQRDQQHAILADIERAHRRSVEDQGKQEAVIYERRDRLIAKAQQDLKKLKSDATLTAELATVLANVDERETNDLDAYDGRIAKLQAILKQRPDIEAAEVKLAETAAEVKRLDTEVTAGEAILRGMEKDLNAARVRLAADTAPAELRDAIAARGILNRVPCEGKGIYARCEFLSAAKEQVEQILTLSDRNRDWEALKVKADESEKGVVGYRNVLDQKRAAVLTKREEATRLRETVALKTRLEDAETRVMDLRTDKERVRARAILERKRTETAYQESAALVAHNRHQLTGAIAEAKEIATKELAQVTAEVMLSRKDLDERADAARAELVTIDAAIETTTADLVRLSSAEKALTEAEAKRGGIARRAAEVAQQLAVLDVHIRQFERRRDEFKRLTRECEAHRATVQGLKADLTEWTTLARIFGREGLPVLEIDAAGPGVSALANDLLQSCFGTRFTVEIITQEPKVDGKGMKEVFELRVWDAERDTAPRDLHDLSGGEMAIVDEAIKSAIALHMNQQSLLPWRTCWRDETIGALDFANALRYVTMLRRILERGDFEKVLFISHNQEANSLVDAQIALDNGRVIVQYPPYAL